jgi:hypothetical protein
MNYPYCIYTIHNGEKLDELVRGRKSPVQLKERKPWITGQRLLGEAQSPEKELPMVILFGDARDCRQLRWWGVLRKIMLAGNTTKYIVDRIRRLPKRHAPQELSLRSTMNRIKPGFIRPYAICLTPGWVPKV